MKLRSALTLAAAPTLIVAALSAPLAANTPLSAAAVQQAVPHDPALAQFAPAANRREHRIDYEYLDEALAWFVVPMGPSIRQGAPRVSPGTGTRRIYGHESRFRLEGNRVAFSFLTDEIRRDLTAYREDLERVGSTVDLTTLPRNEQLAFWINLHNVALIEALAKAYPMTELDEGFAPDDRKLVTIGGTALSPRDIRERIVYPNWQDPKVIYGFWRGVIGGPSIQRLAYTGGNVDALLSLSAEEFVNSLRGVERWNGALQVSPIYAEAERFYFGDSHSLRAHILTYARPEVASLVSETPALAYKTLETDLADLQRGEREPSYLNTCSQGPGFNGGQPPQVDVLFCQTTRTVPNAAIQRLMTERAEKLDRARRAGIRTGMVIFGDGEYVEGASPPEVE